MKITPESIYQHFNTIRDTAAQLDERLKWFCIEYTSLKVWNELDPSDKHLKKIDVYLMAKAGCSLESKHNASEITNLMGADVYNVQICPIENDLIKRKDYFFELAVREIPSKISDAIDESDMFHHKNMTDIGFKVLEDDGQYGKAIERKTNGWKSITWNREGFNLSYLGEKLEKNVAVEIKMDAGTRRGFHGMIRTREELALILTLTR